jgi:hypothetical protein
MPDQKPGCLGAILKALGLLPANKQVEVLPYRLRDDFVSVAELSFYKVLQLTVGDRAVICPKVRLGDIFYVNNSDKRQAYENRIARKHVDYLLCSIETLKPLAGIELDDSSHNNAKRVERDRFVDDLFQTASLPLIRFQNQRSYVVSEVSAKLEQLFTTTEKASANKEPTMLPNESIPMCPKCGIPMVLRTVKQGVNTGKTFYGCPNFPRCREVTE